MINHARTLLLNLAASSFDDDCEEFIPSTYTPVNLPPTLQQVRVYFFGRNPDRFACNMRVRQLLTLLNQTSFRKIVTDLDPRVTYDLDLPPKVTFGVNVKSLSDLPLIILGDYGVAGETGECFLRYRVEVANGQATVTKFTPPAVVVSAPAIYQNALSKTVQLPATDLRVCWHEIPSAAWSIDIKRPYPLNISQLVQRLSALDFAAQTAIFGTPSERQQAPWDAIAAAWFFGNTAEEKLAAATAGLIWRTHSYLHSDYA